MKVFSVDDELGLFLYMSAFHGEIVATTKGKNSWSYSMSRY